MEVAELFDDEPTVKLQSRLGALESQIGRCLAEIEFEDVVKLRCLQDSGIALIDPDEIDIVDRCVKFTTLVWHKEILEKELFRREMEDE